MAGLFQGAGAIKDTSSRSESISEPYNEDSPSFPLEESRRMTVFFRLLPNEVSPSMTGLFLGAGAIKDTSSRSESISEPYNEDSPSFPLEESRRMTVFFRSQPVEVFLGMASLFLGAGAIKDTNSRSESISEPYNEDSPSFPLEESRRMTVFFFGRSPLKYSRV